MKKRLILLTLLCALVLTACVKIPNQGPENKTNDLDSEDQVTVIGLVKDRYVENDKKYLDLDVNGQLLKIDCSAYDDFGLIESGSKIDLTYDKNTFELVGINEILANENQDLNENQEIEEEKLAEKKIYAEDKVAYENFNEAFSLNLDFVDKFGIDSVKVYTDAEKVGDEFLYDDGNTFILVAESSQGSYELFNKRIQLGDIKVNVYTEDDNKLVISLLEDQTAGISFKTFEKSQDDYFLEIDHYQGQGNINMIGSF
ncbi:hypothetical protein [Neofamilia massiliensis]|uniref:hypothetical protein n=1 Tax=Neofamilia massiliensis TaxID=1673724 RepID=UPI0006BB94F8|nr:hypothetical protein [Neofamilia massiliensis]